MAQNRAGRGRQGTFGSRAPALLFQSIREICLSGSPVPVATHSVNTCRYVSNMQPTSPFESCATRGLPLIMWRTVAIRRPQPLIRPAQHFTDCQECVAGAGSLGIPHSKNVIVRQSSGWAGKVDNGRQTAFEVQSKMKTSPTCKHRQAFICLTVDDNAGARIIFTAIESPMRREYET